MCAPRKLGAGGGPSMSTRTSMMLRSTFHLRHPPREHHARLIVFALLAIGPVVGSQAERGSDRDEEERGEDSASIIRELFDGFNAKITAR